MSNEVEQAAQRKANLDEIVRSGSPAYPHRFDRTATVAAIVQAHGAKAGEALEAERPEVTTAGRIVGRRTFGKANFVVIDDGQERVQVYVRADSVSEKDFALFGRLDVGDFIGVSGRVFWTRTNELTVTGRRASTLLVEVSVAAAREVARPARMSRFAIGSAMST